MTDELEAALHPCGRGSGCMIVFGGHVQHDPKHHRNLELEAENAQLRALLERTLENLRLTRQQNSLPITQRATVIADGYELFEEAAEHDIFPTEQSKLL